VFPAARPVASILAAVTLIAGGLYLALGRDGGSSKASEVTPTATAAQKAGVREATGVVLLYEVGFNAYFYVGDTVIRKDDASGCVARIRGKVPFAPAGQVTVAGSFLGQPNGLREPLVGTPGRDLGYFAPAGDPPYVFPTDRSESVTVESTGSPEVPPMPLTELHSAPVAGAVRVLAPAVPAGSGPLVVSSAKPLEIAWEVSSEMREHASKNRMAVSLWSVAGAAAIGEVRCGFDLASGHGALPASLLHEVKERVSPDGAVEHAALRMVAGDWREVRVDGASFVVELGALDSTSLPPDYDTTVQ